MSCNFKALFRDTPLGHVQRTWTKCQRAKYLAIWLRPKIIFHPPEHYRPLFPICMIDIHVKQISTILTTQQYCNTLLHRKKCSLESKTTSQRESPNCGQSVHCLSKSIREKTWKRSKRIKKSGCSGQSSERWPKETKISQESEHQLSSLVENKDWAKQRTLGMAAAKLLLCLLSLAAGNLSCVALVSFFLTTLPTKRNNFTYFDTFLVLAITGVVDIMIIYCSC